MLFVDGAVLALVDGLLREAVNVRDPAVLIASARALLHAAVARSAPETTTRSERAPG